jgi:hypothetical protein
VALSGIPNTMSYRRGSIFKSLAALPMLYIILVSTFRLEAVETAEDTAIPKSTILKKQFAPFFLHSLQLEKPQ